MNKNHTVDLTTGNIFKSLIVFSVPFIIAAMLQRFYNTADTIIVGRMLDKNALSAVSSTLFPTVLMLDLFMGLSAGSTVVCARDFGAKHYDRVSNTVHTSISVALTCGVILGGVCFFLSEPLLRLMNTPDIELAAKYMKIYFLGAPFSLVYNFGSGLMRAGGDSKRPLKILIYSGIINIIGDIALVYFFPSWSVASVALATVLAQAVSAFLVIFYLSRENSALKFDFRKLRIDKQIFFRIIKVGIPAGINGMMYDLANTLLQTNINGLGTDIVAGSGVADQITNIFPAFFGAFENSCVSFVGQNMGAKKYDRINKAPLYSVVICAIATAVLCMIILPFHDFIISIFNDDQAVMAAAYTKVLIVSISQFLQIPVCIFSGTLSGMEKTLLTMLINVAFICGARVIWILFVFPLFGAFEVLVLCYPVSWFLSAIMQTGCFYYFKGKIFAKNDLISEGKDN